MPLDASERGCDGLEPRPRINPFNVHTYGCTIIGCRKIKIKRTLFNVLKKKRGKTEQSLTTLPKKRNTQSPCCDYFSHIAQNH